MMLLDYGVLASLTDHHHLPHHITSDTSFTYDYVVSKGRYRVQKEHKLQSYSPLLDIFKDCIVRTFVYLFEDCVHVRLLSGLFKNIFREESNGQLRMTNVLKLFGNYIFPVNRGDNSYMLTIQTVLGGGRYKNNVKIEPEDHWSCIAHLIAEDMLKSAVIEEKTFKHSPWAGADNPLGPKF